MPPPSKADLWSSGQDETVEVNQRALIDSRLDHMFLLGLTLILFTEILARYSGENTSKLRQRPLARSAHTDV